MWSERVMSTPPPSQSKEGTARAGHRSQASAPLGFSPFFNDVITNLIPVHEKGIRIGFYNSISLIFLLFVSIVIYYCYWVLKPFLQPLVWAILCGSALHPFKRKLLLCSGKWISDVKSERKSIILTTFVSPLLMARCFIDWIIDFFLKYWKFILVVLTPVIVSNIVGQYWIKYLENIYSLMIMTIDVLSRLSSHLTNSVHTLIIAMAYLIFLAFGYSESTKPILAFLSLFFWSSNTVYITYLCGPLGQAIALFLISIVFIGVVKTLIVGPDSSSVDQPDSLANISLKIKDSLKLKAINIWNLFIQGKESAISCTDIVACDESSSQDSSAVDGDQSIHDLNPNVPFNRRSSLMSNSSESQSTSNRYLYALLWAVVAVQLCSHTKFILLLGIPIILKLILMFVFKYSLPLIETNIYRFNDFIEKRSQALFHPIIKQVFSYFLVGDRVVI